MDKYECLEKYFGYDSFREGQETIIDSIMNGRDAMTIMPTGAGKSICYQVPALCMEGITIVVSPLISLMADQVKYLNSVGVYAAYINSSLTETMINSVFDYAESGKYKIIYVAPERLLTDRFIALSHKIDISLIAIDEAHCVSQWGQNFRPSYLDIATFINQLKKRPVVATFTATATDRVKEDIQYIIGLENPTVMITGYNRVNLFFGVKRTSSKLSETVSFLNKHKDDSGIIYCNTRQNVEDVWENLSDMGYSVTKYHAGLSIDERANNQNEFVYDEKQIMVATNAFGMGIDKSNVRFVLHYNMPKDLESYYQEAGRAGRDGLESECVLLYEPKDVRTGEFLVRKSFEQCDLDPDEARVVYENDLDRLKRMTFYSTTTECLRSYILNYFGEKTNIYCGKCSNCLTEYEEKDVTEISRTIISAVYTLGQRYGISLITEFLRGAKTKRILHMGLDDVQFYAALNSVSVDMIRKVINELVMMGYLMQTSEEYPVLKLGKNYEDLNRDSKIIIKLPKAIEKKSSSINSTSYDEIKNSEDVMLMQKLRQLRLECAREQHVPPYVIFSDKTLVEMVRKKPCDKQQMLTVPGIGEVRYEKYGDRFVEIIQEFADKTRNTEPVSIKNVYDVSIEYDEKLFDELRALRLEFARAEGRMAFCVFSNNTLKELAIHKPTTQTEMLDIKGIGEVKYEKYGEQFLELIRRYVGQ